MAKLQTNVVFSSSSPSMWKGGWWGSFSKNISSGKLNEMCRYTWKWYVCQPSIPNRMRFFARKCMKCPDLHRKSQSPPQGMEDSIPKKLGIEWNIQIYTEKSSFITFHSWVRGMRGQFLKTFFSQKLNEMLRFAETCHVSQPSTPI